VKALMALGLVVIHAAAVYSQKLCYTLFISFKLDNWFCVVPLAADPVMGLAVLFLPAVPEREE
jgi:hypothetical protein